MGYVIKLSLSNLRKKRFRTFLTILGVTIGTMSLVVMVTAGIGAKRAMLDQLELMGSTKEIHVYSPSTDRKDRLLTDELIAELSKIQGVKDVYPVVTLFGEENISGYKTYFEISGYPEEYLESIPLSAGKYPSSKGIRPELIVGGGAKELFFNDSTGIAYIDTLEGSKGYTGKKIDFTCYDAKEHFRVKLSVCGETGNPYDYKIYTDINDLKLFARRNVEDGRIPGQPVDKNENTYNVWAYSELIVVADSVEKVEKISDIISDRGFKAENSIELLNQINRMTSIIQLILAVVGSVASVVAVIGVINTMTTAVYDRITEIGLLKLLGADKDDVVVMFLFESALLGGTGGIIGVVFSYVIDMILNKRFVNFLGFAEGTSLFNIPIWIALLAVVGAVVISVLAGIVPARWVAGIKPLKALESSYSMM